MAKGIVVVDMPADCRDCLLRSLADDCIVGRNVMEYRHDKRKPDWCPIKPMPERAYHEDYCDGGIYDRGWNECLDKIEGE